MKKIFYTGFLFLLTIPQIASADVELDKAVAGTPLAEKGNINIFIGSIIQTFLGLLGIIFIVMVIYAGFLRMTASGEAEKVQKSNQMITAAIIGLLIVLGAYTITTFILNFAVANQTPGIKF
jgi:hypothetical protein